MKAFRIIPVLFAALVFVGCSSSKRTAYDDTYYSPYRAQRSYQVNRNGGSVSPVTTSANYDYQAYYGDSKNYEPNVDPVYQTTETVTDTNGVVYTTTETYYDADFAARIKRFGSEASSSLDYYDDYYNNDYYNDYYNPQNEMSGYNNAIINYNDSIVNLATKCVEAENNIRTTYEDENAGIEDVKTSINDTIKECKNSLQELNIL